MGRALAFLVCSLVVFGSTAVAKIKTHHGVYYKPGEILVKFKSEAMLAYPLAKANLYELTGAQVMKRYHTSFGLEHIRISKADVTEALTYYRSHPMVEYAEPNFIYTVDGEPPLPNDPLFNEEWSLYNTGQKDSTGQEGIVDADIDALEAWEKTTGDKNVIVAVIDTGIDYTYRLARALVSLETGKANKILSSNGIIPKGAFPYANFPMDDPDVSVPRVG